jgi:hypothetical protein
MINRLQPAQERIKELEAADSEVWYTNQEFKLFKFKLHDSEDPSYYFPPYGWMIRTTAWDENGNVKRDPYYKCDARVIKINWSPSDDPLEFLIAETEDEREAWLWMQDIIAADGNILPPENQKSL